MVKSAFQWLFANPSPFLHSPVLPFPPRPLLMAALWKRAGHYIFAVWFLSSSSFFPRLISAATDWMFTILLYMVWP